YTLPFAAQPKIHNPIKISEKREDKACFAGSFYRHKYEERGKNLKNILDIAINQIGVDIYDRNYNLGNPLYSFPERFNKYIKGYIPPGELDKVNKGYKVMININTVVDSPTMFSRRVFESLACGTPIVSSYSLGINKIFNGLVVSTDNTNELEKEFINLKNKNYYEMKVVKGIREVLSKHTYYHRLKY
ncbi:glycosyltransferase family protein, partial [Clostridium tertium]